MSLDDDPLWYKDAIIYQLHVRAFCDSDGDGIGDFAGLTSKLDYLHDLGVTALWLLPFYPSPLKDDGYDIADYTSVNPSYGELADFKVFLREAHRRGIRVITELVINHTSDQHPWFQRARRSPPGSPHRDFYVWSDKPDKYLDARIIFKDFEASNWSWDPVAQAYYWHRFYHHQPDLNFENLRVQRALMRVLDFWMNLGVDGMRLDAVPYLYEREGTNCENLPETHGFLRTLRAHIDRNFSNRMLLGEANQWPEDAVAYFGAGDECHMNFHFPVMPRMFMALQMEDRFPIIDILRQTPAIPENSQWAVFLRNHDELTLEMVTDEERDYMYRVYAHEVQARINLGIRRRLAPLLGNNRRKIELLHGLLFALPGTPILYYGDEIGIGDNIYLGDRNGVRTPMQWSPDRNAGFSLANPQKLYLPLVIDPEYHYEAVNVEGQSQNPQSLLWWVRRLIALRKKYRAFGRGALHFLYPENAKVLAFVRKFENETLLVVANLSRYPQFAELDLSAYAGLRPIELFGRTEFPEIGERPYALTLGPHNFFWFSLASSAQAEPGQAETTRPHLRAKGEWTAIFERASRQRLEGVLPAWLLRRRWFAGKAKKFKSLAVTEVVPFDAGAVIVFVWVEYADADPETYQLPLIYATGEHADRLAADTPGCVIAEIEVAGRAGRERGLLCEAVADTGFLAALLGFVERKRSARGDEGEIAGAAYPALRQLRGGADVPLEATVLQGEQSNTSILYANRYILKLVRRLDEGDNPELEIGRYLSAHPGGVNVPAMAGALEYRRRKRPGITLGMLQPFVQNEGNAWNLTLDTLGRYIERVLARADYATPPPRPEQKLLALVAAPVPPLAAELVETFFGTVELLGRRTAEFHLAMARPTDDPAFAPEPFSTLYQRSVYQSMRNQTAQVFQRLAKRMDRVPEGAQDDARRVLSLEENVLAQFSNMLASKFETQRLRIHGDYHLGQVLHTGKDFVIIDFEGEPMRSLSERRLKRSPLRDVAGMLRSFSYAEYMAVRQAIERGLIAPEAAGVLAGWAGYWADWVATRFLGAYLETAASGGFLPPSRGEIEILTRIYLLDKAVYELGYELNNRPDWVQVPLRGILELVR